MPVFFGLLALIPFPNSLNMTRLSSTFAVVEGMVDVMAHLNNESAIGSRESMNRS
jgi:hypothetical protein